MQVMTTLKVHMPIIEDDVDNKSFEPRTSEIYSQNILVFTADEQKSTFMSCEQSCVFDSLFNTRLKDDKKIFGDSRVSTDIFLKKMERYIDSGLEITESPKVMRQKMIDSMKSINAIFTKFGKIIDDVHMKKYDDELIIHFYIIVMYILSIKKALLARRILPDYDDSPLLFLLKLKKNYISDEINNLHQIVIFFHTKRNNQIITDINQLDNKNMESLLSKSDQTHLEQLKKKNKNYGSNNTRKKLKNDLFLINQKAFKKFPYNSISRKLMYDQLVKDYMQQKKLQLEQADKTANDGFNYNINEEELNTELTRTCYTSQEIEEKTKEYFNVEDDENSIQITKRKKTKRIVFSIVDNSTVSSIDNRKSVDIDEKELTESQEFTDFNQIFNETLNANESLRNWDDSDEEEESSTNNLVLSSEPNNSTAIRVNKEEEEEEN